jgi:hypothetical protein
MGQRQMANGTGGIEGTTHMTCADGSTIDHITPMVCARGAATHSAAADRRGKCVPQTHGRRDPRERHACASMDACTGEGTGGGGACPRKHELMAKGRCRHAIMRSKAYRASEDPREKADDPHVCYVHQLEQRLWASCSCVFLQTGTAAPLPVFENLKRAKKGVEVVEMDDSVTAREFVKPCAALRTTQPETNVMPYNRRP